MTLLFKGGLSTSPLVVILVIALVALAIYVIYSIVACAGMLVRGVRTLNEEIDNAPSASRSTKSFQKIAFALMLLTCISVWVAFIVRETWAGGSVWLSVLWPIVCIVGMVKFWWWYPMHLIEIGVDKARKSLWVLTAVTAAILVVSIVLMATGVLTPMDC